MLQEVAAATLAAVTALTEASSHLPGATSHSQAASPAPSSLASHSSRHPAALRQQLPSAPLTWQGWVQISVSSTGPGVTRQQVRGPLQMAGKLGFRGLVNAVPPCQLVYVMDQLSNKRFLVDTSAAFSILPHQSSGQPTGPHLAGPDGHPLACWGDKPVQLVLDGCPFQWKFLLPAVQCPIIGVDFLRAHHLLVDPFNSRLLDLSSLRFLKADTDKPQHGLPGVSSVDKMEGGCARASGAHSMSPRTSTPSLPLPVDLPSSPTPLPPLPNVPAVVAQLLLEFPGVVNPSCCQPL